MKSDRSCGSSRRTSVSGTPFPISSCLRAAITSGGSVGSPRENNSVAGSCLSGPVDCPLQPPPILYPWLPADRDRDAVASVHQSSPAIRDLRRQRLPSCATVSQDRARLPTESCQDRCLC